MRWAEVKGHGDFEVIRTTAPYLPLVLAVDICALTIFVNRRFHYII